MVILVAGMRKLATGLYVDIKQCQRVVWCKRALKTATFAKDYPRRGPIVRKAWDVRGWHVKGGRSVMPVLCRQIDEDLQRMGSGAGARRFIVKGSARGLEPIKVAGGQIEVVAKGVAVVKRAVAVLEHDRHGRQSGMGMCPEGGLGHGEVIDHDQGVHQSPEVCVLIALGLKAVADGQRASVTLSMGFTWDACKFVNMLRVHLNLSLCGTFII